MITEVEAALENIGVEFNQEIFNHVDGYVEMYDEAKKKKNKRSKGEVPPSSTSKPPLQKK